MHGVYVGRFQPFHNGHLGCIIRALNQVEQLSIIIAGPSTPNLDNPYSFEERERMIKETLNPLFESERCKIYYQKDKPTDQQWMEEIFSQVPEFQILFSNNENTVNVIKRFHNNCKIGDLPKVNMDHYSGTNIRMKILRNEKWRHLVPSATFEVLQNNI